MFDQQQPEPSKPCPICAQDKRDVAFCQHCRHGAEEWRQAREGDGD